MDVQLTAPQTNQLMLTGSSTRAMYEFQRAGFLQPNVNLQQAPQGRLSLTQLISCQWDRALQPRQLDVVPGLFLDTPSEEVNHARLLQLLNAATAQALQILANALTARDEDATEMLEQALSSDTRRRAFGLDAIATLANQCDREASVARDFSRASMQHLDILANTVSNRYSRAQAAIQAARRYREAGQAGYMPSIVILYLAAVCDMSGPPDD